jgi:acyl-coenzyme A synthetase/AMP-(fatty) acid ligase
MSGIGWFLNELPAHGANQALANEHGVEVYTDFCARVARWQVWLDAQNLTPGTVVAMSGDFGPDSCAALLALLDQGLIVVPLGGKNAPEVPELLHLSSVSLSIECRHGLPAHVLRLDPPPMHELLVRLQQAGRPGVVLFSSGSSGKPKGIVQDGTALLERYRKPGIAFRTLSFLLLDHIGGLNTLFYTLRSGGTVVTVAERTPDAVCRAVQQHRVELLPVTPSFLNLLLLDDAWRQYDLSSIKLVSYGTEVMPEYTLRRAAEAFPKADFRQTYGLSEVGICTSRSKERGSLWMSLGGHGFQYQVRDGILWIKSQSSMLGYLNAPSPFDADGWLNTGDQVEQDGEFVRILGRKSDIINVGGQKVYPAEVESVILRVPRVLEAAVMGEPHPLLGRVVVASVRLADGASDPDAARQAIRKACAESLSSFKRPVKIKIVDQPLHTERFKTVRRG